MSKVFIIAEIGINHDGDTGVARTLIAESARSGAHSIKFQYRNLDNAYSANAREIGDEILQTEIRKNYLAPETLLELTDYGKELGLQVGISFFDAIDMADFGEDIGRFDFFKVPSAELMNSKLIDAMMATGKHTYISTGCHTEKELEAAFERLPKTGWTPMHCISNYPIALQNARLGYITHMRKRWEREIGYSSHDDHWEACLLAIQLGATVIERHITLDREANGLDHSSSSTPDEFARMSAFAQDLDLILAGDNPRTPNQGELLNRQNLGRSFFADRDIEAGEILSEDQLVYRSPNSGLNHTDIEKYLGRKFTTPISKGGAITRSIFDPLGPLPDEAADFAQKNKLAIPVRLHDLEAMQSRFPVGAFEFHLSFKEVISGQRPATLKKDERYSVHLPDYVSSTLLMDPFAPDEAQRKASLEILDKTAEFAKRTQDFIGQPVPIVGSFSVMHSDLASWHEQHAALLKEYAKNDVTIMPQWLPPIAWYFGGSVALHAMNNLEDVALLKKNDLPVCMDVCHLIMGRNYFGFPATEVVQELKSNIQHVHIADAAGVDGEGMAFGEGEPENMDLIRETMKFDCLKVIEVWQGHLEDGAGFHRALLKLSGLSNE